MNYGVHAKDNSIELFASVCANGTSPTLHGSPRLAIANSEAQVTTHPEPAMHCHASASGRFSSSPTCPLFRHM